MSAPLQALAEMKRLTTPFPEGAAVRAWKAQGGRVVGFIGLGVPEEVIHAAKMLPFRISADNEPLPLQKADSYMFANSSSAARTTLQMALDGKYDFLDGLVVSVTNEGARQLVDDWRACAPRPYMDTLSLPLKRTEEACALYLADLEDWRSRLSEMRCAYIVDRDLKRSIEVYNRGRELMQKLYALRKRERPPITGAENLEVVKAATRMPRERFNDLLEALLREIAGTRREVRKSKRLMVVGSELHNSTWMQAVEEFDAVVVTDELCTGTRYCFGKVDSRLPPMEALARYHLFGRAPSARAWSSGERLKHILALAEQYRVDGVISQVQRSDADYDQDELFPGNEMDERGIPILELEVEYGDGPSPQLSARFEAFVDALRNRKKDGVRASVMSLGSPQWIAPASMSRKPH
jgi:benzoyl-CoA reductase/2-hydroxyglutaryl-CoA dehydratase subunit BcrC/BadD/HgdB